MKWYEKFVIDKGTLATILAKQHNICADCQSDRKFCNAEKNKNCVLQWLDSDSQQDFYCNYTK